MAVHPTTVLATTSPVQATADPTTVGLGLLTQLGDVWFVTLLAVLVYWLGRRTPLVGDGVERGRMATVLGAVLLGIVLAVGLKYSIDAPRPPGALVAPTVPRPTTESAVAWLAGAAGPAFPSGHGVLVTVGWGGLAWAIRVGSPRARVGVVAMAVLAVGASRVALGLHTPEQVIVGVAVGLVALAAVLARGTPRWSLALALGVAVVAIPLVGPLPDVLLVAGVAAGGLLAWHRWGDALAALDGAGSLVAVVVGLATAFPLLVVSATLTLHLLLHVGLSVVVGVLIVALPLLGARLDAG